MFALVLFFAVAFVKGQLPPPPVCTAGYEEKKYVLSGTGFITVRDLTECVLIEGSESYGPMKVVGCTDNSVAVGLCPKEGQSFKAISDQPIAGFGEIYSQTIPSHVAYAVVQDDDKCEAVASTKIAVFSDECFVEEGDNVKYTIEGNKLLKKAYGSGDCSGEPTDDLGEWTCGECATFYYVDKNKQMKVVCSEEIPAPPKPSTTPGSGDNGQGGNGGQGGQVPDTSMCDASYATKYKYMISGEGLMTVKDLSECYTLPMLGESKIIPCNNDKVILGTCPTDGSNSVPKSVQSLQMFSGKWSETFPSHNVHLISQPDDKCTTTTSAEIKAFKINECVEDFKTQGQYMKGQLDGDKMKFTYYSDDKCNTAITGAEAAGEVTCDTCVNNMKLVCHEYGKQPKDESSGSIVTFLLMAFALIFFLF